MLLKIRIRSRWPRLRKAKHEQQPVKKRLKVLWIMSQAALDHFQRRSEIMIGKYELGSRDRRDPLGHHNQAPPLKPVAQVKKKRQKFPSAAPAFNQSLHVTFKKNSLVLGMVVGLHPLLGHFDLLGC